MTTQYRNISDVFRRATNITIDKQFAIKVLTFINAFVRKNDNHINFFGGNLIGVYPVKWLESEDKIEWFANILHLDSSDLKGMQKELDHLPGIVAGRAVSGDITNLSFVWIAHEALNSPLLTDVEKMTLAKACINMMQYKFITSIHSRNFQFQANMSIALATYEQLDNKSILKRAGSWKALVDLRTDAVFEHDSKTFQAIKKMDDNVAVVLCVNAVYNAIKSIMKVMTRTFHEVKISNAKIAASDKFTEIDGQAVLKDYVNEYSYIKGKLHGIIPDKNSFIRDDVVKVTTGTINTCYPIYLLTTLRYMSDSYEVKNKHYSIPGLVDDILTFALTDLKEANIKLDNIVKIAETLRGRLRSSRLLDPRYLSIKERLTYIVEDSNFRIQEANIASTRIAVVLYIVLRALIKT